MYGITYKLAYTFSESALNNSSVWLRRWSVNGIPIDLVKYSDGEPEGGFNLSIYVEAYRDFPESILSVLAIEASSTKPHIMVVFTWLLPFSTSYSQWIDQFNTISNFICFLLKLNSYRLEII